MISDFLLLKWQPFQHSVSFFLSFSVSVVFAEPVSKTFQRNLFFNANFSNLIRDLVFSQVL